MQENLTHAIGPLGLAFLLSFITGNIAKFLKIPKVTGYIFVGVMLGPSAFNVITPTMAEGFHLINEIAFGLILFNIGGEFHQGLFRNLTLKHLTHAFFMSLGIILFVSIVCFSLSGFTSMNLGQQLAFSLFLGITAINAAPPTTLLVIKESDAAGPLTHLIMVFLAVGTVMAIVLSKVATLLFQQLGIWQTSLHQGGLWSQMGSLLWSITGPIFVGLTIGLILSLIVQREKRQGEVLLACIVAVLIGQTLAVYTGIDPLLTSLFLGFALVNIAPTGMNIHSVLNDAGSSIYALFFVLAGAHLNIQEQFKTIGLLGAGYIFARTLAMMGSSVLAARISKEPKVIGKYLGMSTLSHAAAALALVMKLKNEPDVSAQNIISVILSSIIFFEIFGPLALRYSLSAIGEILPPNPMSQGSSKVKLSPRELLINFLRNTGLAKTKNKKFEETISEFVNKNILSIEQNASFLQVTKFINEHQLPIYTVIDENGFFVGTITLDSIKRAKGRFHIPSTKTAKELAECKNFLREDACIKNTLQVFDQLGVSALPVLKRKEDKLIGLLYYKDIIIAT